MSLLKWLAAWVDAHFFSTPRPPKFVGPAPVFYAMSMVHSDGRVTIYETSRSIHRVRGMARVKCLEQPEGRVAVITYTAESISYEF